MKKYVFLLIVCILSGISLAAYSVYSIDVLETQQPAVSRSAVHLKEGTYKVEFDNPDFRGWKAFFVMQVDAEGHIKEITYDYVNKAGILKTKDENYNKAMKKVNGVGPAEYCPRLAKNLMVYQNPDEVDSITGATHSAHYFKDFAKVAFKNAQSGNETTIYLPQPELVNPNAGAKK